MVARKLVFDDWLEQGDVIYIPRGFIHQVWFCWAIVYTNIIKDIRRALCFIIYGFWLIPLTSFNFIFQAFTDEKSHSHHVTVSVNRKSAFVDMIEKILPEVVKMVADNETKMRFSLPPNVFDMGGVVDMSYDNDEAFGKKYEF